MMGHWGALQALGAGLAFPGCRVSPGLFYSVFPSYSASVRLPASTVKLGEKLERYHTAIQVGAEGSSTGAGALARVELWPVTPLLLTSLIC